MQVLLLTPVQRRVRRLAASALLTALGMLAVATTASAATVVDASTLNKKVMAGYQGWFMTAHDGSGAGWRHWAGDTPNAANITFEMWPDMRELSSSELEATSFVYRDGKNAGLYSAYNPLTVERHVKWMQDYQIDGVFVQRFIGEAVAMPQVRDKVLQNVRTASEKYGRVFANMYDISGGNTNTVGEDIKRDWVHLVDDLRITQSDRYLRHEGRPVVSIWGFGFSDRPGSSAQLKDLINWFKSAAPVQYRATVMLGVDTDWRSHSADWLAAYRSADVISPWSVGRYNDGGADDFRNTRIAPDLAALKDSGVDYMPVVFPGFSWWNLQKGNAVFNQFPRKGGRFFWHQAYNAQAAGANMVYVAMFDEVDEGTAMYKIAENASQVPSTGKFLTLDADGEAVPSDWYLRLMGEASRMLKSERPLTATMPGDPTPSTGPTATNSLQQGAALRTGQRIVSSNGLYRLELQGDGNLVTYAASGAVVWTANTQGKGGTTLYMQGDGNLVLYTAAGAPVWASGTNGQAVAYLILKDSGVLTLVGPGGATVWSR